jgi:hypothetical protein
MSRLSVSLTAPPRRLRGYPLLAARDTPATLFRLFHLRDGASGALNSPWRFSSVPPGDSRFDVPVPEGTCYWSDRRYGSWVEVFRGTGVVDRADVTRRALFVATPPRMRWANTLALAAHRFGGTGELSTIVPYDLPQRWAALRSHGFAGLVAVCRHDPSLRARNFSVFGPAGVLARRTGWTTRRTTPLADLALAGELAQLGVRVAAVPYTVPITAPPRPPRSGPVR